jgi:ATP-binding cassette subfamily C protein CydC
MAWISGLNSALGSLLAGLTALVVLVIAIPLVSVGRLEGVELAVLTLAAITSLEAVLPLPGAFQHLSADLEAARRLFEIVDAAPAVCDPPEPFSLSVDRAQQAAPLLRVSDLRFRYSPDDPPALDGISFTLLPGRTLAVVGASGAGKSTLVNLLLRFWDYADGRIMLDGRDLHAYAQDDVRALFSVVTQYTYLFNGTVRDNLLIACPNATGDELIRAARQAQLHDFIASLPQGYDTWIGDLGLNLSGGERQRLAIARAILKDAPILILDEATANLDAAMEGEIMRTVQAAMQGRTTLIITHRLARLDAADEILVLRAGRIVEQGRHDELLQMDGYYWSMWEAQNQILEAWPTSNTTST